MALLPIEKVTRPRSISQVVIIVRLKYADTLGFSGRVFCFGVCSVLARSIGPLCEDFLFLAFP